MPKKKEDGRYRKPLLGVLLIDVLITVGGLLLCLAVNAHVPILVSVLVGLVGATSAVAFWPALTNAPDGRSLAWRLTIAIMGGVASAGVLAPPFFHAVLA